MLLRTRFRRPALLSVLTVISATPALADTGFYVGATAGASVFHEDLQDTNAAIAYAYAADGINVLGGSSTLDKTDAAFGALLGYRFIPEFSVEAAYVDLGKLRYKSTDTISGAFLAPTTATATLTGKAKGPTLTALGILPVSPAWEIYARAGMFFSKVTLDADIQLALNGQSAGGHDSVSANSVDPLVGVGTAWHVGNHIALRAEYTRFINVGDKDKTGEENIDLFNIGVTYSFQ